MKGYSFAFTEDCHVAHYYDKEEHVLVTFVYELIKSLKLLNFGRKSKLQFHIKILGGHTLSDTISEKK